MIEADFPVEDGPVRPGYVDFLIVNYPYSPEAIAARKAHPELSAYADNVGEMLDHLLARLDRLKEKLAALESGR
jgi:hypothetical protein